MTGEGAIANPSRRALVTAADDFILIEALIPAAWAAGDAALAARSAGLTVDRKADASPVTEADRAAEAILLAALAEHAPGVPVIAEEQVAAGHIPPVGDHFILVDALDGTKDFLKGGPDFTANVGIVRNGHPVASLVLAPAKGKLWIGSVGLGAYVEDRVATRRPIRVRKPHHPVDIIASRSHRNAATDAFIARFPGAGIVSAGSSLKFCVLAEGLADLYPRLAPTSQWDTAAGDAILRAAGGRVLTLEGIPLPYGPGRGEGAKAFLNPSFVATAGLDPFASLSSP
jgi:3'(2'),5'-bisphosphate nucleotidase